MPRKENTRSWVHYSGRTLPHSSVWPLWHLKSMVQGPSKDPWLSHSMARWQKGNQLFHADQATRSGQPHFTITVGRSWIPYIRRQCLWWPNLLSLPQYDHAREQGSGNEFQDSRHNSKYPDVEMIKFLMFFLWLLCELEMKSWCKFSPKWGSTAPILLVRPRLPPSPSLSQAASTHGRWGQRRKAKWQTGGNTKEGKIIDIIRVKKCNHFIWSDGPFPQNDVLWKKSPQVV